MLASPSEMSVSEGGEDEGARAVPTVDCLLVRLLVGSRLTVEEVVRVAYPVPAYRVDALWLATA